MGPPGVRLMIDIFENFTIWACGQNKLKSKERKTLALEDVTSVDCGATWGEVVPSKTSVCWQPPSHEEELGALYRGGWGLPPMSKFEVKLLSNK